ncbi:putative ATP-dependent endonuclease of the OLD family [Tangfeifania diversioriginum]|uniref:Putative ATP-dependent endonuclease of the OLD family n=1 Tax=Tangfeifania diversioriginum TaxID=1168035 RepID=A0A1M6KP51_9BACT|nr:AAA family ATPase [Tangfeifania diversioriginum]SHJ60695.1 putative ATP-dependent endonuclease of the OLD family [Tangfeifania diversioriginum]
MYLAELKLWNFRKYGNKDHLNSISTETKPDLIIEFKPNLNVLIGENDSGKTSIIDAIKYVLNTKSLEYFRLEDKDFYEFIDKKSNKRQRAIELRIECKFKGFTNREGGSFLEWIGFDKDGNYELRVWLTAYRKDNRIFSIIRAGQDEEGIQLEGEARENLKVTYLKPLRDALSELTPGYKSRLADILGGHDIFKTKYENGTHERKKHELEIKAKDANDLIRDYFKIKEQDEKDGAQITKDIYDLLKALSFQNFANKPAFELTDEEIADILKTLKLVSDSNKSGLGSLNKLYMAAEFLLLKQSKGRDLKLALIEELEAHLHPQAQLKVIDALQGSNKITDGQLILTTHSTTLASKVKLDNLILCHRDDVYPMFKGKTKLGEGDYEFLERFLDATKANLFFARGVIMVEGDAENILVPTIAEILDRPLQNYGVSLVNVSNAYFFRYARIFQRKDDKSLNIPVACISDLDVEMKIYEEELIPKADENIEELKSAAKKKKKSYQDKSSKTKIFISPLWTLEFDLLNSTNITSKLLLQSILEAKLIRNRKKYRGLTAEDISALLKKYS